MAEYQCAVCGKENVKLWRPYGNNAPLICATCAEERQTPIMYNEISWREEIVNDKKCFFGTPTGKKLPLKRWMVDAKGNIPLCESPGPDGTPAGITKNLIVDLRGISESYKTGNTTMVPAIFDPSCGEFWTSGAVPQELVKAWEEWPPTR